VVAFAWEGSSRWNSGGDDPVKKTWRMGRCALESGDAFAVIPVRKLISLRGPALHLREGEVKWGKSKRDRTERAFSSVHPDAGAIDSGSRMHVAAVPPDRGRSEAMRTFGTCTGDLQRLADWFERCGVRTIAMESRGVYGIPIYEVLEQRGFELMLVNARDAKHVPGRETDVSDAQWLRQLHEYGLLRERHTTKTNTVRGFLQTFNDAQSPSATPCTKNPRQHDCFSGSRPARLEEISREKGVASDAIEVWFADEARVSQKNKITRRWAKRQAAQRSQRSANRLPYIFGAIGPEHGKGAAARHV
jgi:Transposase